MKSQMELLAALQRDISERLRPVCADLSEESFQELVREIALVNLKYRIDVDQSPPLNVQPDPPKPDSTEGSSGDSNVG